MLVRVGSRGSRLALIQAEAAARRLRAPGIEIALVPITTAGDRDRTKPFGEIGSRGVFVKELEEALLDGRIDVAVHSAKDMTSTDPDGLLVGAYLAREDPKSRLSGFSDAVQSAIAEKKAVLDMPAEALEMAWGYPVRRVYAVEGENKKETWVWPGEKQVVLLDGRVSELPQSP